MAQLPESQHTTANAIVRWYESKPQEHRPHMGASIIGHACNRYIWNTWRWVLTPEFQGRILRLFDTGKREEARLLEELRGIGCEVWDTDPATGDQWRVSACNGHFGGSLDGVAKGLPEAPKTAAVLEFKTHNDKSFMDLCKVKVQGAKPQHYVQMQVYMGLMQLDRALYMAVNKNTDDVYCEWVHFDKATFDDAINRAQRLIDSPAPPEGISTDPTNWQ
ncbi:MAG: oxidoreductase, partial [Rhodobacteraceae bacterium]|nr:oxidoreductase [Paracoccaceae bacterium]